MLAHKLIGATESAPPFLTLSGNNFYTPHVVNGIDSGGGGPSGDPGTVSYNGQSFRTDYWLGLKRYLADSGSAYTSSRDMVFVNNNSSINSIKINEIFGIDANDVRRISSSVTVNVVMDVDDRFYTGYWLVNLGSPPTWANLSSGTWTYGTETYQPAGGRQRNISLTWTLPVPASNQMFIIAGQDNGGTNNLRYTLT